MTADSRAAASCEFPATFAQRRLFFVDRLSPGNPAYNVPGAAVRIRGRLAVDVLHRALDDLAARHETLRTRVTRSATGVVQLVADTGTFPLRIEPVDEAGAEHRAAEFLATRFDVQRGPLAAALLLRLGRDDHVLVVAVHHLVCDGWSAGVLQRDLSECYAARLDGRRPDLPRLSVQYGDFAIWQQDAADGPAARAELDWWVTSLADPPAGLDLPLARPRPPAQTFDGGRAVRTMPAALEAQVRGVAAANAVTPYPVLLAAWSAVLARYSGRQDLLIGTPVGGRLDPALEDLIGYFANTVVLRVHTGGRPDFTTLLARVADTVLDALGHQETPFDLIVDALAPVRDRSRNPLFQHLFTLNNFTPPRLELRGARVTPFTVPRRTARFDLSLEITEQGPGLHCALEYNADLYDLAAAESLLDAWFTMLHRALANPGDQVDRLPLLTGAKATTAAHAMVGAPEPLAAASITEMFAGQAARAPAAVAVIAGADRLTYQELDHRSGVLASGLLERGARSPIGVCLSRGVDAVVAMLGVLKAGAAYLPMEPAHPPVRLERMLADSGASAVLTDDTTRDLFDGTTAAPLVLDVSRLCGQDRLPVGLREQATEAPAYVIYTSGSTGRPKGVTVAHGGVVNLVGAAAGAIGATGRDRWSCAHSFAFDLSVWEIWGPLLTGGSVVLVPPGAQRSVSALDRVLRTHEVSVLSLTPSVLGELARFRREETGGVPRVVISGGEPLPSELAGEVLAWPTRLWNFYGPTETTVWAAIHRVGEDDLGEAVVPIGGPLANTSLHVRDSGLRPVPDGVPGELCIGGRGLALGYHGARDLTARQFVADPVAGPHPVLYRTGDLVLRRQDGTLRFLGRDDGQVKVRGFRIELGEVEAALRRLPGVGDAVAAVRSGRLVGYLVARPGQEIEQEPIRAGLRAALPEHLVPTLLTVVEAIPLTANGKVDRAALPEPGSGVVHHRAEPPRGPAEIRIAALWAQLLGRDDLSREDDFFAVGGHSLLAMRLNAELNELFGVRVGLEQLFGAPTVAGMAALVEGGSS
ncbi:non-ribosomal peptide synthetase [Amycolatopsis sp. H20-H5]|uniref:non-ribosomal peptide synthetase n=1 Tax=Amycolatopsis sp. H20-H5 TaxID=3046309 RepID=UPI002DBE241C|nr:amino acid adenylation domain-containing protein [Amycolatopsis sp. H20-H5]MEC3979008.1 amino acid adenylation domain-containing protein [Amycolatopsis sp. H20-H5]